MENNNLNLPSIKIVVPLAGASNYSELLSGELILGTDTTFGKGFYLWIDKFMKKHLIDPKNPESALLTEGVDIDLGAIKISTDDLPGWAEDKLIENAGVSITRQEGAFQRLIFSANIGSTTEGISLMKNGYTVKSLTSDNTINLIPTSDGVQISLDQSFLEDITYGIKYSWATENEMLAQTGMSTGDLGVRDDVREVWRYDGSSWSYFFTLGTSKTEKTETVSPETESFSGSALNQKITNEEVVQNLVNIYNLIIASSPAYGDLRGAGGDEAPILPDQSIASTPTVTTWTTVNQSSNTDVWQFNDASNEILVKKAGFYTFNTNATVSNSSSLTRILKLRTRNKNDNTEIFYTRSVSISKDGEEGQSSVTFEVKNDNTTIEILAWGESEGGTGVTDLTFTRWDSSFLLNFQLNPEYNFITSLLDVTDPTSESVSETAQKQSVVNQESRKILVKSGKQNILSYQIVNSTDTPTAGKIHYNQASTMSIKIHNTAFNGGLHGLFDFLKKDSVFIVYSKLSDNTYIRGTLTADPIVDGDVYQFELTDFINANYGDVGSDDLNVCIDFMSVGGSGGDVTVGDLSGCFAKVDFQTGTIVSQSVTNDTWEILDLGSFSALEKIDLDTSIIWDDTNKRILNNGTTTKKVEIKFSVNISLSPEGGGATEDNLLVAVRNANGETIVSSYLRQSADTNLNDSKYFGGSYVYDLDPGEFLRLECFRNLLSASSDFISIYDFTFNAVEIGSTSEEATISQTINYYNLGQNICNNDGASTPVGSAITGIGNVYANGSGWLMKSPNGNTLSDIPLVANKSYSSGLCPLVPVLDSTKIKKMTLRSGNCRVFDQNRNTKTGTAYVEIAFFVLDHQSIVSTNHQFLATIKLYDREGGNNNGVVGSGQTSNSFVVFENDDLDALGIFDKNKQYGYCISGTSDQNPPVSLDKIYLMDTAILTVLYSDEVN